MNVGVNEVLRLQIKNGNKPLILTNILPVHQLMTQIKTILNHENIPENNSMPTININSDLSTKNDDSTHVDLNRSR